MITKSKSRRLLLLNDLVVCVSVSPKATDDFGNSERLSLKWTYPVTDIEVLHMFEKAKFSLYLIKRMYCSGRGRGISYILESIPVSLYSFRGRKKTTIFDKIAVAVALEFPWDQLGQTCA